MRTGSLPPAARIRARIPAIDVSEDVGLVGQPEYPQPNSGLEPYRVPTNQGMPRMSEASLIRAHRCACVQEPTERRTLAEWDAIETAQRAFAADAELVAAETADIERARKTEYSGSPNAIQCTASRGTDEMAS